MGTEIVQVTAVIQDSAAATPNFGTIGILAYHTNAPGPLTVTTEGYSAELVAAGFSATHDVTRKAAAIAAVNPRVDKFKVFQRAAANAQKIVLTPTELTEDFVYGPFSVNGTDVSVTVPASADEEAVVDLLVTEIDAISGVDAVKDGTGSSAVVWVTPTAAEERVYIDNCDRELTLKDISPDAGVATAFAAAVAADNDFYGVLLDSQSEAEALVLGPLCEAAKKIFLHQSADTDISTSASTDVASDLVALGLHYTGVFATRYMSTQGAARLLSTMFARDPGSANWALKDLAGAGADSWSTTEIGYLDAKKTIRFESVDGIRRTMHGWAVSGRFFDLTRGTDYLVSQIKANVLTNLVNLEGVRQTNTGLAMVQGWVMTPIQAAVNAGLITPGTERVTVPDISEISDVDKINRLLDGVKFYGTFGGFWNKIQIAGTLKAA